MQESEGSMSKENQIEEMARIICRDYNGGICATDGFVCNYNCEWTQIAKHLYNAGYRKQNENTVELPCKVGDTVYRVKRRRGGWNILPREVTSITYRLDHLYRVVWEIFSTETDILGKTVFLTEIEAEKALAKMKGGGEE
jgi:hypothetical protein